jgi:hypothetical protein
VATIGSSGRTNVLSWQKLEPSPRVRQDRTFYLSKVGRERRRRPPRTDPRSPRWKRHEQKPEPNAGPRPDAGHKATAPRTNAATNDSTTDEHRHKTTAPRTNAGHKASRPNQGHRRPARGTHSRTNPWILGDHRPCLQSCALLGAPTITSSQDSHRPADVEHPSAPGRYKTHHVHRGTTHVQDPPGVGLARFDGQGGRDPRSAERHVRTRSVRV